MSDNEYYASNDSNLEKGQTNVDVGQDEGKTQEKSSSNEWKDQAKYFQSEKDKLYAENQKLNKLAQVGNYNDNVGQDLNTTGPNFQRAYRGGGL